MYCKLYDMSVIYIVLMCEMAHETMGVIMGTNVSLLHLLFLLKVCATPQ